MFDEIGSSRGSRAVVAKSLLPTYWRWHRLTRNGDALQKKFVLLLLLLPFSTFAKENLLVARVTYLQKFIHEKRCGDDFCDGYVIFARDEKTEYALICVLDFYDRDRKTPNNDKPSCKEVPLGSHIAKTDDENFWFIEYSPAVKYQVFRETPLKGQK